VLKSTGVEDTAVEVEKDHDGLAVTPTNLRSASPKDPQNVAASESDIEDSIYRQDQRPSSDRSATSKARRSQSMDDIRTDDVANETNGSDKICDGGDGSENGNGENGANFTTDREEVEVMVAHVSIADDEPESPVILDTATESESVERITPVRAESFKEAMRSSKMEIPQPDYSRMFSQPLPSTMATTTSRDSRSSWIMPAVFPSLEETFNEWFASAMERTGSLGSSSSTPRVRTRSETTSMPSVSTEGNDVQMRRTSRNSTIVETSPLNTPEFHEKRLTRVFNWKPTHLGTISGSSDSLDSSEMADNWVGSGTYFPAASRLPPGFETGFFDRDFGIRPPLLSRMPQPFPEPNFLRQVSDSVFGNSSLDTRGAVKMHSESLQPQSSSTSRIIPIKVVTSQSSTDADSAKAGSGPRAAGFQFKSEDECDPAPVSKHKTPLRSTHSSKLTQHSTQLPAGFLTGFNTASIPSVSDADTKHSSKVVGRLDSEEERRVRVIPIIREQNTVSGEVPTRKQQNTRGRVIPVMVQSSGSRHEGNPSIFRDEVRSMSSPTFSQTSETAPVRIPVNVVQSGSGMASNSSTSENRSTATGRKFLPLCYDDEEVKKILQEMTIRRLPIRDTVRLLNMKTSRSMDCLDSRQDTVSEESLRSGTQNRAVDSPTISLLPVGFWVGNSSGTQSSTEEVQTASHPVTGSLIRKRLHQFDANEPIQ